MLASKSSYGISVKCSQYRDTGPTNPSLLQGVKTETSQASDETNPNKEFKIHATIFSHISDILTSPNT